MQGKGIIKFFLVALAVVSLLQFIYILPTNKVENAAESYAKSQCDSPDDRSCMKQHVATYLDSMSTVKIFSVPLLKDFTYQDLKASQLNFGLDLKGGMSVLMQVDLRDFVKTMAGNRDEETVDAAIARATEKQKNSQSNFINLFVEAWKEVAPDKPLNSVFKRNESLSDKIDGSTSDSEVATILRQKADETVDLTFKLLRERIDKLGVVGPNVSLDAARDLIMVELPGVDNPQRARTYLQAAAKLEFWNVYRLNDPGVQSAFIAANDKLRKMEDGTAESTPVQEFTTTERQDTLENGEVVTVIDTTFTPEEGPVTDDQPALSQQGPLFDMLTMNDGSNSLAVVGTADKNKRNNVVEMLRRPSVRDLFPRDAMFLW